MTGNPWKIHTSKVTTRISGEIRMIPGIVSKISRRRLEAGTPSGNKIMGEFYQKLSMDIKEETGILQIKGCRLEDLY